ncbi:MAG: DoxX family protein [Planctomycetes bacterium]|nr:DoxX family protein [Planctomycetota bacterium]NUQ34079.1 DoxX family protein [Planctomycetaceae bacterium]
MSNPDGSKCCGANDLGLLVLRLGFGGVMAFSHGLGKLNMLLEGEKFPADPLGFGEQPTLILAVLTEFVCSLLIVIGAGTRIAAFGLLCTMATAIFLVHANDPWDTKEPAVLFAIPALALLLTGAGRIAIDPLIVKKIRGVPQA